MWINTLNICILIGVVHAEQLYNLQPQYVGEYASAYDNYKPTDYKFEYGVSDPHTGDHKSQWEVMENGIVRGAYSLLEPDGTTRVVDYYADDTGFHANVRKIGTAVHDAPHYGTLHSIADAHIANSLAYNGYGHGGITSAYGAPISVLPKIASAIPQPVPAPIAHVQHIPTTPQVIAPHIHHIGSPYDAPYAPHLNNPSPFQLPLISKSYEDPIIPHPTPFVSKDSYPEPPPVLPDPYYIPSMDKVPLSKYFLVPAMKIGGKILPASAYYTADQQRADKVVPSNYVTYTGYEPEVAYSAAHNYPGYDYNVY